MSELRQDPSSGDWVILAPGRFARPHFLDEKKKPRKASPKNTCPFEHPEASGNWPPIAAYPNAKNWKLIVIPNKYPALSHDAKCAVASRHGIYNVKSGVGSHELLVTRDHNKNFADLNAKTAKQVFRVLQERHRELAKDKCSAYISSFFNWGPTVGASIWHPHYQTLTLPIIPPHTARSLRGAEDYFKVHGNCVRCDIIKAEKKEGTRIIEENQHAIAISPFSAKQPFEVSVLPKRHISHFGSTPEAVLNDVALLLQSVMRRIRKYLNDPDLNFYIHSAPLGKKRYPHHHWHIEVVPKISIPAGFELSTGIDVNIVDPDVAARILRGGR